MKIVKILVWFLLLVLLTFNVYSFVMIKVLGNELAVIGGKALVEVISGSMEPTIKVGDMIIIDTEAQDFKEKDIITFKDEAGSFVTHRIMEVKEEGFVTKGDNNDSLDRDLVREENIVGRYCFKIAGLGIFISALKNPITFVIIMLIGVILCFLSSTDKDGKPVDVDDDYLEFLDYKNQKKKNHSERNEEESTDNLEEKVKEEKSSIKSSKSSTSPKKSGTSKSSEETITVSTTKKNTSSKSSKTDSKVEDKSTKKSSTSTNKKTNDSSTTKKNSSSKYSKTDSKVEDKSTKKSSTSINKKTNNSSTAKKKSTNNSSSKSRTNTKK